MAELPKAAQLATQLIAAHAHEDGDDLGFSVVAFDAALEEVFGGEMHLPVATIEEMARVALLAIRMAAMALNESVQGTTEALIQAYKEWHEWVAQGCPTEVPWAPRE